MEAKDALAHLKAGGTVNSKIHYDGNGKDEAADANVDSLTSENRIKAVSLCNPSLLCLS